ncbi:uncharacterized protein [Rutidosis leptorrhynchoides]|uniref:uncharacterized protein n=1 Tax=Rutidosis leptorrhynchoides TaxID=125765 RepID=UPI003A99D246
MISAVCWIPKGVAKAVPAVADPPSKEEIEELIKSGALEIGGGIEEEEDDDEMVDNAIEQDEGAAQALAVANALSSGSKKLGTKLDDIADGLKELDMDNYDEEDDEDIEIFGKGLGDLYYPSNELDPYLKDANGEDSEEEEDMMIKPKDLVVLCARNEDDVSQLEINILEESSDGSNMYVHHDIILSAFPLCTAWLDCPLKGGEKGNFIAIGSMEPTIEIWDLDIIDEVQPAFVLGGILEEEKKTKKKKSGGKKKKSVKYKEGSHTDSVLGLAWNKEYRNLLASASADNKVKIWDVHTQQCNITMDHHTDKVQAVAWNQYAPQVLLSGSFDHTVVMKDGRDPSHPGFKWSVSSDVESLTWDPHAEHLFVVSLEDGTVQGFDIRNASSQASESKPSFTLHAHDKAVCTISYNPAAPNLLATGSTDKMVKLWDLSNSQPNCIASKNPKAGAVFSVSFSGDSPFLLAIGGSKGTLEVWDTSLEAPIARTFGKFMNQG